MPKPHPAGGTFAERAAATAGEPSFTAPEVAVVEPQENSTFAQRAAIKPGRKADVKQVDDESPAVEDKSVPSASNKRPRKSAAKKP